METLSKYYAKRRITNFSKLENHFCLQNTMSDLIKEIVDLLNNPPLSKNLSWVSFDALEPNQLVQLLNDVISYIEDQVLHCSM